jgi:hypothetical protein
MWELLEKYQSNFEVGMTRERYYDLCEQLSEEPDPEKIPPEIQDFPIDAQKAILIFNKLGDRVIADIGYMGKDYTNLKTYIDVYEIVDQKLFLEVLLRLDAKIIEKSAAKMAAEREKLKAAR